VAEEARLMPTQDPPIPGEPTPFYTAHNTEYDYWNETEITVDPLSAFTVHIPPHDGSAPIQPGRREASARPQWRDMLARWLQRLGIIAALLFIVTISAHAEQSLLNVSYDPTRELYTDYNRFSAERWKEQTGQTIAVRSSHSGSGEQARAVIDGLEATS
jgi:hypothetical protein